MVRLLSSGRASSSDPAADRLRLAAFADVAQALADALESAADPATLATVTDAVRRAFARLLVPGDDAHAAAAYEVARDIATNDCDFIRRAARQRGATDGPDLVLSGYGRWVREQLDLIRSTD